MLLFSIRMTLSVSHDIRFCKFYFQTNSSIDASFNWVNIVSISSMSSATLDTLNKRNLLLIKVEEEF